MVKGAEDGGTPFRPNPPPIHKLVCMMLLASISSQGLVLTQGENLRYIYISFFFGGLMMFLNREPETGKAV